jgi:hypothetical protein
MHLSTHHYALELARAGNLVYFLNPPEEQNGKMISKAWIRVAQSDKENNLFLVTHALSFPYILKFKLPSVFHWLMKSHVKNILSHLKSEPDIIWSFDLGNLYPFRLFRPGAIKIFHPVDEPLNDTAIKAATGSQIIFSVTKEILQKYEQFNVPRHFVNHGVSSVFLKNRECINIQSKEVKVAISGNLTRNDIDRDTLLQIVTENANLVFHFFGSNSLSESNIGGTDDPSTTAFINALRTKPNVVLHGVISPEKLAEFYSEMDAFLVCYDIAKDQSRGTNYHKIMEFLSSGKVIVSNNITTYQDQPNLVNMVKSRVDNKELPALFAATIKNLSAHNSCDLQKQRKQYACNNSYACQMKAIEAAIIKSGIKIPFRTV